MGRSSMSVAANNLARHYVDPKTRKQTTALQPVSFEVAAGTTCGLLGPNGAGKTTLVKMLSTILLPSSGSASVCGLDVVRQAKDVRRVIGLVLGGEQGLYNTLTARQNLEYWAAIYEVPHKSTRLLVERLLGKVSLTEKADARVETFSRGMKQRLHLARGIIGNPQVVFLDEPTIGMDPVAAHQFRNLVRELQDEGKTLFITTHDMDEAEAVCSSLMLIDKGKLLGVQTPQAFAQSMRGLERIEAEIQQAELITDLRQRRDVAAVNPVGGAVDLYRIEVTVGASMASILSFLIARGVTTVRTPKPSLEEAYLNLFGQAATQAPTAKPLAQTSAVAS
jgi:ABC-2 type transport system ATP-binding protein